jgi:hypothetical protein
MQEGKYICDSCVFWNKYSPMCMIKNIFHENREIKQKSCNKYKTNKQETENASEKR